MLRFLRKKGKCEIYMINIQLFICNKILYMYFASDKPLRIRIYCRLCWNRGGYPLPGLSVFWLLEFLQDTLCGAFCSPGIAKLLEKLLVPCQDRGSLWPV